jgi:hypothetical protein
MLFLSCPEVIEAPDDSSAIAAGPTATVLASGILFGHQQYRPVPSIARKVPGRPWVCAYHCTMIDATMALSDAEEKQRQSLIHQIRIGRMVKSRGWLVRATATEARRALYRPRG